MLECSRRFLNCHNRNFHTNCIKTSMSQSTNFGLSLSRLENRSRYQAFQDNFFYDFEVQHKESRGDVLPITGSCHCSLICQWPPGLPEQVMPILPVPRRSQKQRDLSLQLTRNNPVIPVFEQPAVSEQDQDQPSYNDQISIPQNSGRQGKTKNRTNFTSQQRQLLEKFFYEHIDHPYADHRDLELLEKQTNLSKKQIRIFMTNARMRKVARHRGPIPRGRRPMSRPQMPGVPIM